MKNIEKAERVIARLNAKDKRKLRYYIDECLLAAIKFDETRAPEHLIKMKSSMEKFLGTLDRLEKET
jgi:hypothetical protein